MVAVVSRSKNGLNVCGQQQQQQEHEEEEDDNFACATKKPKFSRFALFRIKCNKTNEIAVNKESEEWKGVERERERERIEWVKQSDVCSGEYFKSFCPLYLKRLTFTYAHTNKRLPILAQRFCQAALGMLFNLSNFFA